MLSPEKVAKDIENVGCVMPVHWCGNAGDLDEIMGIAKDKGVPVIEDAAQAPASLYKDKFLGTHGDLGVFHSMSQKFNDRRGRCSYR